MILKRVEKENKIKAIYASSNILASTYDKSNNSLTIIFNKGGQYKYADVTNTDYTRFETAESQGVILNSHIKKYAFEKLAEVDPTAIVAEINTLKTSERQLLLEAKQARLVKTMRTLISQIDASGNNINILSETDIKTLQEEVATYLTEYSKTQTVLA